MARPVLAGERAPPAPPPDGATNTQGENMNKHTNPTARDAARNIEAVAA